MDNLSLNIYAFIYDINALFGIVGGVVGVLISVVSFAGGALLRKHSEKKIWRLTFWLIGIVALLLAVIYIYGSYYVNENYTRVPSVIDNDYREAKSRISEAGLISEVLFYGVDDYRVVSQSPEANTFVEKDSNVDVVLEERDDSKDLKDIQEEYKNHEQIDVVIEVKELLGDIDGAKISRAVTDLDDIVIYLYEPKLDKYIREYSVSGNEFCFKDIPEKVKYDLYVYLEGYEVYESTVYVSKEKDDSISGRCEDVAYMPIASAVTCSKSIKIENNSEYSFEDLLIRFEFEGLDYKGDQFYVDSHGIVECELHYYKDLDMTVIVSSEIAGGSEDASCKVKLETYDVGYVAEEILIRLNDDLSCQVE